MSFGFGNTANTLGSGAAGAGEVSLGPELETIQTEDIPVLVQRSRGWPTDALRLQGLGFLPLAGEAKVRLTSPWITLPVATSSLLSIASRKGLVAAAGPDEVIIATTESVRKAFSSPKEGNSEVRAFEAQLRIPMSMRISHLAFTADENYLILSAETGGGLAVYEVQSLLQRSPNSAFELSTNGESLRYMVPNPVSEKSELCAVVTSNGNLYMANFKERKLSGPLKTQVTCLSWSAKGKQLCAGMADGTISQMTPEGEGKGNIPKPPDIKDSHGMDMMLNVLSSTTYATDIEFPVSSLVWLENNLFLVIHTTTNESLASAVYHIISRQAPSSFTFQKLTDPVEPFGKAETAHHSILRLRDFLDLQDLLIVSSTATTEVGILTRSKTPLANDKPADSITNVFTTTEFLEDTRRPTLPMTNAMYDSVSVGVALDLSSRDQVYKPIPSNEELDQSPGPLPGFWALTNEGVLCSWWIVYNEAVKKGKNYPGLAIMDSTSQPELSATPAASTASASPFAAASTPFGSSATPTATSAFGTSSQLGQKSSPWGAAATTPTAPTGGATFGSSTFGSSPSGTGPAFGRTSSLGFGQSSQLGMRTSPWASGAGSKPAFGQSGFSSLASGGNSQSPFGAAISTSTNTNAESSAEPSTAMSTGGFSAFSSQGGFLSLGGNNSSPGGFGKGSMFGTGAFGTPTKSSTSADTAFPAKQDDKPLANPFASSTPFKLESSFKPDPFQKDSNEIEMASTTFGGSMFGSAFGSALGDAAASKPSEATPLAKDEDMDTAETTDETSQIKPRSIFASQQPQESTTPTTTPAPARFSFATTSTPGTSLFGPATKTETPSTGLFGTPKDTPKPGGFSLFGSSTATDSTVTEPKVKIEGQEEPPLPPDTTSKASFAMGGSSSSSATSNPSQLFGSTAARSKPDINLPSSGSTTPKPSLAPVDVSATSTFPKTIKQSQLRSMTDVKATESVENPTVVEDAPLPPDFTRKSSTQTSLPADSAKDIDAPAASGFVLPKAPSKGPSSVPSLPETTDEDQSELGEDEASEGSGVDVAKDLSPVTSGVVVTPGFTPQSSFGGIAGATPATARPEGRSRPLFGEIGLSRGAPVFPKPSQASPRSPSPVRGTVPQRVIRSDATRSVSAPGMASQILGPKQSQMHPGSSIISDREKQPRSQDPFMLQHRRMRERQEAEETQLLVDDEDDEMQKVLSSDVEGTLQLDEFIAHSNVAPPAKESVPSQVEAVYRDINSMIDTLGLNARAVKAFTKGHTENAAEAGRSKQDLEIPDDWVLCEINELGEVLDNELHADLENGRVLDLDDKLDACQDLLRDMQRLRAKQEDLKRVIMTRMDPEQVEQARTLPLSSEQAAQQNELRREFTNFTTLLTEAEEALTLLKTRITAVSSSSGRGITNVPTVEAVMRTICKMTSMAEKRSGDIDVLETQLRRMRLGSASREASPMVTPQARKSIIMSPDSTPSRNVRQSLTMSSGAVSLHAATKGTPPRKKLSGFSKEEKKDLMETRARRQAVLAKLKDSIGKRGVNVWNMEDIE
ncbi:nuclear pore complex subunit Nup159 [Metarhizium album ARSEF 1941]|uniref:Nuclear pore complex subunit Nup159 n=1 Tax=Metarhizium album (strain ARSEF 1941) TaxID=1081103 RepID=A0A0B2WSM0_METAS|nr:nuclear pore complex subunit Nup159 [Metarhizium album ARSEF 1941]KHN96482.1 nuclear pore complex subunit Nup159 [Metarhizium album ARSEF 1941]